MTLRDTLAIGALAVLLSGCAVFRRTQPDDVGGVVLESAVRHLELAAAELEAGAFEVAVDRLVTVRELDGLGPDDRKRCEEMLDDAVGARIAELVAADETDELLDLSEDELPVRLRARAGVRGAELLLAQGDLIDAYRTVQSLESEMPGHPERVAASRVLADAGFELIEDTRRYYLVYRYDSRGIEALEYLVLTYPTHPRCAEAYVTLARAYERRGDLDEALLRHEDLLLYHAASPLAVESEARLAWLRLARLERDDHDRSGLEEALRDVTGWKLRYPGHELEPFVLELEAECQRRLASSDMITAHFYERVGNPFGARLHAERALVEANASGDGELIATVDAFLAGLPAAEPRGVGTARPEDADAEALEGEEAVRE